MIVGKWVGWGSLGSGAKQTDFPIDVETGKTIREVEPHGNDIADIEWHAQATRGAEIQK